MAAIVRLKLDYKAMGLVALQSAEIKALIAAKLAAGCRAAAELAGEGTEELGPKLSFANRRWYGTYGLDAETEARTSALSSSVRSM